MSWPEDSKHYRSVYEMYQSEYPVLSDAPTQYPGETIETDDEWMDDGDVW